MIDEDSPSVVSSSLDEQEKTKSWNLDHLHDDENSDTSSVDFFTSLEKSVAKHVYFGRRSDEDEEEEDEINTNCKIIERSTPSTVRVDSSDLISRCRDFLPLFTDANRALIDRVQSGENVRIELDSDHEETTGDSRAIEMNLMFCPDDDDDDSSSSGKSAKESGEVSTSSDDGENQSAMKTLATIGKKKRKTKKKKKKKNRKRTKTTTANIVEIETITTEKTVSTG